MIRVCSSVDHSWLTCWNFVRKKQLFYCQEFLQYPIQGKTQHNLRIEKNVKNIKYELLTLQCSRQERSSIVFYTIKF